MEDMRATKLSYYFRPLERLMSQHSQLITDDAVGFWGKRLGWVFQLQRSLLGDRFSLDTNVVCLLRIRTICLPICQPPEDSDCGDSYREQEHNNSEPAC
jgi:hypothetical protein